MASTGIASIIFLFLLSLTLVVEIEAKLLGKHHITVYSNLPEKSYYSLLVHCGSKNDDFGSRVLYHGQIGNSALILLEIHSTFVLYCGVPEKNRSMCSKAVGTKTITTTIIFMWQTLTVFILAMIQTTFRKT
ncbi:hypothetical protein PHJA_001429100 [Phtheirospermum japonicum]|uniref:Uncharacterized protein n=1 Tax=Phtheirospermum japonicum TaxID=374723 RepID=A0A830C727_9LAMI|nr:hypothetical protein PHJA_001429100 [Phtheirospermum japonicum]